MNTQAHIAAVVSTVAAHFRAWRCCIDVTRTHSFHALASCYSSTLLICPHLVINTERVALNSGVFKEKLTKTRRMELQLLATKYLSKKEQTQKK